jgi:hypothetical protein
VATTKRSFIVHVYADGPCTVEDVRTGTAVALDGLAAIGDRIASLLSSDGAAAGEANKQQLSGNSD